VVAALISLCGRNALSVFSNLAIQEFADKFMDFLAAVYPVYLDQYLAEPGSVATQSSQ